MSQPQRGKQNTTLTISLPRELKQRIQEAAERDRRAVSPWVAIQLEKVLDNLESESKTVLRVAEEAREGSSSPSTHAGRAPVSYRKKRQG